jgi:opacity protein-like surface antigen
MKSIATVMCLAFCALCFLPSSSKAQYYDKGKQIIGLNLNLLTDALGYGADYEYGYDENFGVGGIIRYWGKSSEEAYQKSSKSLFLIQVQGLYHFTPKEQVDPFLGARLGYGFSKFKSESNFTGEWRDVANTTDGSGAYLNAFVGARYHFSPKISANGSLELRLIGKNVLWENVASIVLGVGYTL